MKPEYIGYGLYAYYLVGFLLWLWVLVDDYVTGNRHHGGFIVALETMFIMMLFWPFIVADLIKPRGRK